MTVDVRGATAILLAGTGSDDQYVRRAFAGPLHQAGASIVTPSPEPRHLVDGYLRALDEAASAGPVLVGGVSIGAAVAAAWALSHPSVAVGVLAALPAWSGASDGAPAALAARHSAAELRRDGLDAAIARMRSGSPQWLADELSRSWTRQWPALPDAMEEAASYVAPTTDELRSLTVPMGVAAATGDLVHPIEVALSWAAAAPRAALRTVTLDDMGEDPAVLGAACVSALLEA